MSTENGEQSTTIGHLFSSDSTPEPQAQEPVATEQAAQPAEDVSQQPQEQAPATEAAPQAPQPHTVPLAELIETRKRAQAAEEAARRQQQQIDYLTQSMQRLSQPEQQQPDPELDPAGALQALRSEFQQSLLNQNLNISERYAREKHGDAAVEEAIQAAVTSGYGQVFASKPDAYKELMAWHEGQKVRQEIGADPAAYRQSLETEIRAKILAEMKQGAPPPSNLPPSLSSTTRVNGANEPVLSGRDFFNDMMNQRSR